MQEVPGSNPGITSCKIGGGKYWEGLPSAWKATVELSSSTDRRGSNWILGLLKRHPNGNAQIVEPRVNLFPYFEPKAKADRSTVSDWVFLFWSRGFYLLVFPMPFRDLKAIAFHYRLPRIEKSFVIWVHPRSSPALQITQPQTTIQKSQGFGLYLGKRPHTLHVESLWFRPPASPPPPNHLGSSRDLGELLCHASMVSCGNGPVL